MNNPSDVNPAHQKSLEYLWNGELKEYQKFIFLGSDARQRELFCGGVYFLWDKDGLQYIGQSDYVWQRLNNSHQVAGRDLSTWIVGVIPVEDTRERRRLESYCISTFRPPVNRTTRNPAAKVEEIFRLRSEGKTLQFIGNKFGITHERVRQILKGL
jgi:hypothetical protein